MSHKVNGKRQRVVRVLVGLLLSGYGIRSLVLIPKALHDPFYLEPPELSFVEWWPVFPQWLCALAAGALTYLGWMSKGALALTGMGVALGHRQSMRLSVLALGVLIVIEVMLGFPTAIGFAAGWISCSPEMYERLGARQALPYAKLAYYQRMGGWIILAISLVSVLVQVAAIAYLRRLLASDRQGSRADEVV